jgi:hypothetical protein
MAQECAYSRQLTLVQPTPRKCVAGTMLSKSGGENDRLGGSNAKYTGIAGSERPSRSKNLAPIMRPIRGFASKPRGVVVVLGALTPHKS